MLVLSRKIGEKILIGDNIVLTVVKIDRNQIRLGIEAPADVRVFREEICPPRPTAFPVHRRSSLRNLGRPNCSQSNGGSFCLGLRRELAQAPASCQGFDRDWAFVAGVLQGL